jgi:hypothetical protein
MRQVELSARSLKCFRSVSLRTPDGELADNLDKSYWSAGKRDEPDYASQKTLYDDLGVELLDHSFEGFNTCIFACKYPDPQTQISADQQMVRLEGMYAVESKSID